MLVPRRLPELGGVELWLVEGPGTAAERRALRELLSEREEARAARFKVERARESFLVSRGVLRRLLGEVLKSEPDTIQFGEGPHGKPFLAGAHSGCGLEFNVSHSGDLVLFAISRRGPVGVDVELNEDTVNVEALARRHFSPAEADQLLSEGRVEDRMPSFYRCWTRKEAYLKARGTGLTTKLDSFEVSLLPGVVAELISVDPTHGSTDDWRMYEVPVPTGYSAALVVAHQGGEG
jgi:4'-phosphopantetheinyl transferase